jgi:two-component system, OmpR family, response regulator CpxR
MAAAITIFSGVCSGAEKIVQRLVADTDHRRVTDEDLIARAAELSGISRQQLNSCFAGQPSVFNPFTRERERFIAWIKLALAELCQESQWVLHGYSSHLIPTAIQHILHTCVIADLPHRVAAAVAGKRAPKSRAAQWIATQDLQCAQWTRTLKGAQDPWNAALYDILLPTHALDPEQAVQLLQKAMLVEAVQPTERSRRAADDFLRAARIEAALAAKGHVASTTIAGAKIHLRIDRPVLMLERLEQELIAVVRTVDNHGDVEISVQPNGEEKSWYRPYSHERPSKVLLVDDEREFVQTLSERLEMRDIGSVVAFDGESALELIKTDQPEVMLLDLQMPGIDGMEVLKRVKAENPEIEVIILTGHGTDQHRDLCLKLGAFAYLEKPVDIDKLSETMKQANEKMRGNSSGRGA